MGLLAGSFEKHLGGIDAGQIQQRDALIQRCDLQLGVAGGSLLKSLEPLLEKLLVHVSRAQIVQACSFGGIAAEVQPSAELQQKCLR